MSVLEKVRRAIFDVFGDNVVFGDIEASRKIIEKSTYTGAEDPGQWAPEAAVIIHCEEGLDSGCYNSFFMEKWFEVNDKLGDELLVEHFNAAIIAVYQQ